VVGHFPLLRIEQRFRMLPLHAKPTMRFDPGPLGVSALRFA